MYPYIYEINTAARLIPRRWERCFCWSCSLSTSQSFHNSTGNFRVHACVTFLVKADKRPLLMVHFLKHLETSPFCWRRFCRWHAFPQTWNIFTNGTLIPKIYTACSFVDAMFSLGNSGETSFALRLSRRHRALPKANLHISIFHACATRPTVASVSSGTKASATPRENRKGCVCLLLLFHEWQNVELLRGYPYFRNALLILMIFQNKYGRAVTAGMYASSWRAKVKFFHHGVISSVTLFHAKAPSLGTLTEEKT